MISNFRKKRDPIDLAQLFPMTEKKIILLTQENIARIGDEDSHTLEIIENKIYIPHSLDIITEFEISSSTENLATIYVGAVGYFSFAVKKGKNLYPCIIPHVCFGFQSLALVFSEPVEKIKVIGKVISMESFIFLNNNNVWVRQYGVLLKAEKGLLYFDIDNAKKSIENKCE